MRFLRNLSGECLFVCSLLMSPWVAAEEASPDQLEFFEKRIRPLLIEHCQECHGSKQQKGGLRVDSLRSLELGGETGPAIDRQEPGNSLLLEALLYDPSGYQMPPSGKLSAEAIADVQAWLKMGAPWPLEETAAASSSGEIDLAERARHWSFQPVQKPVPPSVSRPEAASNLIDAFILHRLETEGLSPSPAADRRTLARRLSFDLRGLPPSVEEVDAFVNDPAPDAYERLVDRWLASPAYGERWGRHWLDLVRYAETYGHEFDYDIEHPTPYRDYVVRAWNADLAYDQFIREHLAGDLLPNPRRNPADQKNESVIGTAFWWFSQGKHSPVDIRQEECDMVDNQIDVFGKTFLGLTIACARCHDHKFDAITAKDYYALAGYLQSSRLHVADRHPPEVTEQIQQSLAFVDHKAKAAILDQTFATLQGALSRLPQIVAEMGNQADDPGHPFSPLRQLSRVSDPAEFQAQRQALVQRLQTQEASRRAILEQGQSLKSWNDGDYGNWLTTEFAYGEGPVAVAKPVFQAEARHPILELAVPGVAHTGVSSGKLRGTLRSPTFPIQHRYLDVLVHKSGGREHADRGQYKQGLLNVIVDGFQIIRNPLYGHLSQPIKKGAFSQWYRVDLEKFQGRQAYLEIEDLDDGYVVLEQAILTDGPLPPRAVNTAVLELLQQDTITNADQLLTSYRDLLASTISTWQSCCDLNATQADLLNPLLRHCRTDSGAMAEEVTHWAQRRAELENRIPAPDLTLAMIDGSGENEFLLVRGNPKKPGEAVARRFLEVFTPAETVSEGTGSGREQLAEAVADPTNPLTARVLVNRLWQHHFGRGLMATPDDFGKMGQAPSHPELLDALATEFIRSEWSIKRIQRLMVLSQTYQQSSRSGNAVAEERDPQNRWLHRQNRQRLEGEAIRDALLVLSGRLDDRMGGPSVFPHLTPFMEGRGRPGTSGPLDGEGRRSLYINVRRNFLSPFFLAFDFPTPFTTMGRRSTSNVPAQALTMMNNPFVVQQARQWAERTADAEPSARVETLYEMAFARLPHPEEQAAALAFVAAGDSSLEAWSDLCHVLLNTKEFVFVE